MMKLVDPRRAAFAAVFLAAVLLPLYLLVLKPQTTLEAGFSNAVLADTPPVAGPHKVGLQPGDLAPNFEISTTEGGRITLAELRGKPVLITFFALWCGSCLSEMPDIKAIHEERGLSSFNVLAINTGESRDRAMEFIDYIEAPFVWTLDFDLTVSDAYAVKGLPQTVYVDASGIVRAVYLGEADRTRISAYLDAAFAAGQPPELPFKLRIVSTIPRERTLLVEYGEPGNVAFSSRTLRCDPTYCATSMVASLQASSQITSANLTAGDGEPRLDVRFDESKTDRESVVRAVVDTLEAIEDPLYTSGLVVNYASSP